MDQLGWDCMRSDAVGVLLLRPALWCAGSRPSLEDLSGGRLLGPAVTFTVHLGSRPGLR